MLKLTPVPMELMVENLSVKSFQTKYENFQDFIFNMAARSDMRSKLLSHSFPFLLSRGHETFSVTTSPPTLGNPFRSTHRLF